MSGCLNQISSSMGGCLNFKVPSDMLTEIELKLVLISNVFQML